MAFIEGVKSVIDVSGAIQGSASNAISNGIESAFGRIKKPLEQSLMKVSCIFVSLLLMGWGLALFLDSLVPYRGLGFVTVGACVGIAVLLFLQEKETRY